ncbi:MAG: bacillithiol system redox-active protein YtxJ [Muriicola sp.]|nr:bacillithiol system redox-active protein YtxJ [Muriicola sp.]MBT8282918.1 bacillithiol system redox-active protein YtxJ [Muriicola sp.]NNK11947.1 bacillithiol system redox-active protein YtxJ [Flavobacteriaceae bacterium]
MGVFNWWKGADETESGQLDKAKWNLLESESQLEEIIKHSGERIQIIFKNSTSCGISGMVKRSFEANFPLRSEQAELHLIHVQYNRGLSNAIAQQFGVRHESPQLLVIKNGNVVKHASHGGINNISVEDYL